MYFFLKFVCHSASPVSYTHLDVYKRQTIGNAQYPFMHEKLGNLRPDILLKRTKKGAAGKTPDSPLCHAVASYLDAQNAYATWQQQRQINLLHSLRKQARTRLATLKRQQSVQTYDDLIDGVADALLSEQGDALASNLRGQYRVALVDDCLLYTSRCV